MPNIQPCRILSIDGGGAKGFYTLGVLKQIEGLVGVPLCERFHLIYGTSTGAIIGALLALGYRVDCILKLYKKHVPPLMCRRTVFTRTQALRKLTNDVFKQQEFSAFKTNVGIVATHWAFEKPMIFKSEIAQAHGQQGTFVPGFGCKIADAVRASCSAYPLFNRPKLRTSKGESVELADGGYCANNPTLFAIADAVMALGQDRLNLRVISLGVGTYPQPKYGIFRKMYWLNYLESVRLLQKTLDINTSSMEILRQVLFKDVPTIRIDETFSEPEMATDLMEYDLSKLDLLYQRGQESFASKESDLKSFLL